ICLYCLTSPPPVSYSAVGYPGLLVQALSFTKPVYEAEYRTKDTKLQQTHNKRRFIHQIRERSVRLMFRFSCAIRAFSIGDHLAQRDDRAVLAAGRLLWWFLSAFKRDVTDPVLGEQVRDLGMHLLPHAVRVGERSEPQAHAQARGCRLHNLEQLDSGGAIEQGPEGQRRDADLLAAVGGKGEHISGAALDANCGQGTATWTRIGTQEDAVAQIVAHNRLHPIGKVRDQDRVRLLTRRDRPIVGIHWLEHDPVEVHVLPALLAAGADEEAL